VVSPRDPDRAPGRARIDKWGLFSYHYLARNLAIVSSSLPYYNRAPPSLQINTHGLALWFTTPIYLWLLWPRSKSFVWRSLAWSVAPVFLALLLYQNSGWLQFGYRFSNDFAVFLFAMQRVAGGPKSRLAENCIQQGIKRTKVALHVRGENKARVGLCDTSALPERRPRVREVVDSEIRDHQIEVRIRERH